MKIKTEYWICFTDEQYLQTDKSLEGYTQTAHCVTFEMNTIFDTKLEALEHLQEYGNEEYNYTILEVIKPYKGKE